MHDTSVTLAVASPGDMPTFKTELQKAFLLAVVDEFGALPEGPIPSDSDLDQSIVAPGSVVLNVLCTGEKVGGAILKIDDHTNRNSLDFFFIVTGHHGRGLGQKAWKAIEERYPETLVWSTHTPYFEKRNIHFYVNKCGFKIVEFFWSQHADPHHPGPSGEVPGGDEMFRFEKVMRPAGAK